MNPGAVFALSTLGILAILSGLSFGMFEKSGFWRGVAFSLMMTMAVFALLAVTVSLS